MTRRHRTRQIPPHARRLLDRVGDTLKHVETSPGSQVRRPELRVLLDRAEVALAILHSASSVPDGFPTSTPGNGTPGGGKGGRRTIRVAERAGARLPDDLVDPVDRVDVPVTSVEAVVLGPGRAPALVDELALDVEAQLRHVDAALERLRRDLDRLDALRSTVDVPDAPQCYVASVIYRLPWDPEWSPSPGRPLFATRFVGYLNPPFDEDRKVCRFVYDFTRKHNRLPTDDEMRMRLERGAVRVQTGEITTGRAS